jgi:hypothetical protein
MSHRARETRGLLFVEVMFFFVFTETILVTKVMAMSRYCAIHSTDRVYVINEATPFFLF